MHRAASALVLLSILAPVALAQDAPPGAPPEGVSYVIGGEPGIHAFLAGVDLADASHPRGALPIDPEREVNLSMTLAPPPGVTWEVRSIRVGVVVNGPGSSASIARDQGFNASLPPGFTVFVNRTIALHELKNVGTGLFLMRLTVTDENATKLYEQEFYVKIEGNVFLTASGAVVTAASVATGYGLWQILRDAREAYKAHDRHRKERARSKIAKGAAFAAGAVALTGGIEGLVDAAGDADAHAERLSKRGPFAWSATGLGLGGVTLSWLQFLGYVPFNLANTLIVAFGVAATFMTVCFLIVALAKRAQRRAEARTIEVAIPAPVRGAEAEARPEPEAQTRADERRSG